MRRWFMHSLFVWMLKIEFSLNLSLFFTASCGFHHSFGLFNVYAVEMRISQQRGQQKRREKPINYIELCLDFGVINPEQMLCVTIQIEYRLHWRSLSAFSNLLFFCSRSVCFFKYRFYCYLNMMFTQNVTFQFNEVYFCCFVSFRFRFKFRGLDRVFYVSNGQQISDSCRSTSPTSQCIIMFEWTKFQNEQHFSLMNNKTKGS